MRTCCILKPLPTCLMHHSQTSLFTSVTGHDKQMPVTLAVIQKGLNLTHPCLAVTDAPDNLSSKTQSEPISLAGPLKFVPITFAKNYLHSCPEMVRYNLYEVLDCCAHDMWGAGYLMHTALTNTSPWSLPPSGNSFEDCKQLCKLHEDWVSLCCPLLSSLSGTSHRHWYYFCACKAEILTWHVKSLDRQPRKLTLQAVTFVVMLVHVALLAHFNLSQLCCFGVASA